MGGRKVELEDRLRAKTYDGADANCWRSTQPRIIASSSGLMRCDELPTISLYVGPPAAGDLQPRSHEGRGPHWVDGRMVRGRRGWRRPRGDRRRWRAATTAALCHPWWYLFVTNI